MSEPKTAAPPRSAGRPRLVFWGRRTGIFLGLCLFFLPTAFYALPWFGIEPSWRLTLNKAFSEGWAFGDRLIWTYGPLGFLETRFPYGVSPWYYLAFDLLVLALFMALAFETLKQKFNAALAWACIACLLFSKRLIHDQPSSALFCLLVYLLVRMLAEPAVLSGAALVLVSVVLLFFKMNFGLSGLALCAAVAVWKSIEGERSAWSWWLVTLIQLPLIWAVGAQLHTNPLHYVTASLALVRQYSDGMAWSMGPGIVTHWVVCLEFAAYLVLALLFLKRNGFARDAWLPLALGAAALFVLYKTAVVRSDYAHHQKCFLFGLPLIALAFMIRGPNTLRPVWRPLFLGSTIYASLLLVAEFGNCLIYMQPDYLKAFFPVDYFKGMAQYRSTPPWAAYSNLVRQNCPERAVPQKVLELIGTNSVDVFPFESTLTLGSGLNYQPRPVPQTYGVLGRRLESRNLAFYESAEAPRFVLYVLGEKAYSSDGRYHFWDEPALKRFLQQQYSPQLVFTNLQGMQPEIEPGLSPVLLLERKRAFVKTEAVTLVTRTERAGQEFPIPDQPGELYARINIRKSLWGRFVSFFYRGAPVHARFRLEDGSEKQLRIVPANLETGVLVNFFADGANPQSTLSYFAQHSRANPRCVKLRIDFDHRWEYHREVALSYFTLRAAGPVAEPHSIPLQKP